MSEQTALGELSENEVAAVRALRQIRRRLGKRAGTAVVEIREGGMVVYAVAMAPEKVRGGEGEKEGS